MRHIGRREPALRELSLTWRRGERLLLLGPSGSGKSTLALCLNGVIPHSLDAHWEAGAVLIDGIDTRGAEGEAVASRIGEVFQDPETQLVTLTIDDEIAFGLENRAMPRPGIAARVAAMRARLGLDGPRVPERLDALSGGTKQRVAIASVLAMRPEGLVLDEPTANLDPQGARDVARAVAELCADGERSLLLIEHRLDEILDLIDRVAVLDARGTVVREGTVDEVFGVRDPALEMLGVWIPELTRLARLLGSLAVPRTAAAAGALLGAAWPRTGTTIVAEPAPGSAPEAPLITASDVAFRYPGAATEAVAGATLQVRPNELLAIVGANGAGKSTLGLMLAGALRPARGRIALGARDMASVPEREIHDRVAYVFQYPEHQFVSSTVQGDILAGPRARGRLSDATLGRARDLLERFGLARLAGANPHALSHGEKRRLSVATALMDDPEALILDEPTFGQDPRQLAELLAMLEQRRSAGRAVVVITHDMSLVADHADRVIAMAGGGIVFDGQPDGLFADDELLERCGLVRPPIAEAFRLACAQRTDIPPLLGLRAATAALR